MGYRTPICCVGESLIYGGGERVKLVLGGVRCGVTGGHCVSLMLREEAIWRFIGEDMMVRGWVLRIIRKTGMGMIYFS